MTDPWDDRLHEALSTGAARFAPASPLGATRTSVVGRVRRGRRRLQASVVLALVVVASVAIGGVGRSVRSSSRQVAAGGEPTTVSGPAVASAPPAGGAPGSAAGLPSGPRTAAGTTTVASSVSAGGGVPRTTTAVTVTTVTPPFPTPSTGPTVAVPPTSVVPVPVPSGVRGTVTFSPVCPVAQVPPLPACAPRPGAAHIQLVRADGSVGAEGSAGSDGQFDLPVLPGEYTVQAVPVTTATALPGRGCVATPNPVAVSSGEVSVVAVSCDTGIR